MDASIMRKAIVAANKRRQRLIRAGFKGFANVNLIQNIIDTANRINPFSTEKKKRTTLNPKATGAELRRQFLAAKQILNMEKSSLRVAKRERRLLESEVRRRETLAAEYGFEFENMSERRIKALYNCLSDSKMKQLMELYSSDEVVTNVVEAFNNGMTVKDILHRVTLLLNSVEGVDELTVEDLEDAFAYKDNET